MRELARAFAALGILVSLACSTAPSVSTPPIAPSRPATSPTPTPPVVATPLPTPTPTLVPTAPPPIALPETDLSAPLIRVLLRRSREEIRLPQPGRAYRLSWNGDSVWLWGPLTLEAESSIAWQVGAWSDAETAARVADELAQSFGEGADTEVEVTSAGLRRVRIRWSGEQPPDASERLAALGHADAFPVHGAGLLRARAAAGPVVQTADEVLIEPAGDWPTVVGERRYRGRFRARAGDGGAVLINELNLESYLEGVVPVEMGPYQFPELEALKAQAVAARTYAAAHLGDHEDEGYDICATPACQVYHGAGAEHSLSSRAVHETAGLIAVYEGAPIDAMYTSTCGGHTEDVGTLFPGRNKPYLAGVACEWERDLELDGVPGRVGWRSRAHFEEEVALAALDLELEAATLQAALDRVATLCGGRGGRLPPEASVEAYAANLLAAAGLDEAGEILTGGTTAGDRLLAITDLVGVELPPPDDQSRRGWFLRAAAAVCEVQGVISRDRGEAVPHPEGVAIYPRRGEKSEPLPMPLPLYRRWGESYEAVDSAVVRPGQTLERVRRGEQVLALVVQRSGGGGEADRRSAWRSWVRERSWRELAESLGVPDLERLEITERTASSGRVVGLAAVGRSGVRREWSGFSVRRALDLPETLFTFHRLEGPDGESMVRFIGRGWGHAVGLCQNGAFGLARAGRRFEEILGTYYSGVAVERWDP